MFKQNEGRLDRIVRVALGVVLLPVGLFLLGGLQSSVLGLVIAGFGVWVLITGLIGFCPLYIPLGIDTLEKERELITRCFSMMAGFRRRAAGGVDSSAGQMCGRCAPSIGNTHNEKV